jgi:hypothetical protein
MLCYMSTQTVIADRDEYDRAVARRITNARYDKALAMSALAASICRINDADAESLKTLTDAGWRRLAQEAGYPGPRYPSAETQAMVIRMVDQRLRGATV